MNRETISEKVKSIIIEYLNLNANEITNESHMVNDIGIDSLALVELGFKFSETFEIPMIEPTEENMVIDNLISSIEELIK